MTPRPWCPADATAIAIDPEVAAIAVLDAALAVTIETLSAMLPELDGRSRCWAQATPTVLTARHIVVHSRHLRDLLADYRHRLQQLVQEEIPF